MKQIQAGCDSLHETTNICIQ